MTKKEVLVNFLKNVECSKDFKQYIINNCLVNADHFEMDLRGYIEDSLEDLECIDSSYDAFENMLEEKMDDYSCETIEELVDDMLELHGDAVQWYIDMYGEDRFFEVALENDLIDVDVAIIHMNGYKCSINR